MQTINTPPWLTEPCPSWCVVLHEQRDQPSDRRHVSASLAVPVTQLRGVGESEAPEGDQERAAELMLCLHRLVGSRTTWLYAGDGRHQGLELSTDSWSLVAPALDRLLAADV